MEQIWLSGWYDPELIDYWEEFVAGWEETPPEEMSYVYFPPSHYSHAEAKSFVESRPLEGGGFYREWEKPAGARRGGGGKTNIKYRNRRE